MGPVCPLGSLKGSEGPPKSPREAGSPTRRSKRGREALLEVLDPLSDVQMESGGPPASLERVGRPFQRLV